MGEGRTTVRSPRAPRADRNGVARLRVTSGAHRGELFELDEGEWIVGKGDEAQIQLRDSGVSRRHAKVVFSSDGMVVIIDLQSTNGTYVNDNRIEMTALREGHRIGIGPDAELQFTRRDITPQPDPRAPAAAPPVPQHPLTKRELQIAQLVAQGLTNPQVADRLGVKPSTVSSHLDNIYARLKISSRAALTRYIIESGLG